MAGLLTAQHRSSPDHFLQHVLVADRRAQHADAIASQRLLEAQIGHDGGDHHIAGRWPAALSARAAISKTASPSTILPLADDKDSAVRIAVECDTQIRPALDHRLTQRSRHGVRRNPG